MKAKQRKLQKEKEKQEKQSNRYETHPNSSSNISPQGVESPAKLPSLKKLKNESKAPSALKEFPKSTYTNTAPTQPKRPDSPVHFPTESEKSLQLQKMLKIFNIQSIAPDSLRADQNSEYHKYREEIKQLEEEIQIQEDKLELQAMKINEENKQHKEDIDALETELFNSGKGEVIALKESNRYYDSQIKVLTNKLEPLSGREKREKAVDGKMRDDIQLAKMRLEREITEVRKMKEELMKINKGVIPIDIKKRIEVMIKYCTSV